MAALDNTLQSKYLQRPVVRQRNSVTLAAWAGYKSTETIPSAPDDAWVRLRVMAEAVPLALDSYTAQTLAYFLQDPNTTDNIGAMISEDNTSDVEVNLSGINQPICDSLMPRFANTVVSDQQVTDWRTRNNAPAPGKGNQ